jgi:hypothetical protein
MMNKGNHCLLAGILVEQGHNGMWPAIVH